MKLICALASLGITLSSALAEDTAPANTEAKNNFRIIASPYEGEGADVPSRVFRIKEDDVRMKLQSQSFPDALHQTPGIYVQKTAPDRGAPIIRGFTSSRNVLIADGVRVNTPLLREGPNEFWGLLDPFAYNNIEVILGPGSVIYGSDAIGGVVLANTRSLSRGEAGKGFQFLGGDALFRYGTAQHSLQEHVQMRLGYEDNMAFSVGLSKSDYQDLEMGSSEMLPNSDYETWGGFFRMEYDFDDHSTLVLGYDHFDVDDTNRVHKTQDSKSFHGTAVTGKTSEGRRNHDFDRRAVFARYLFRDGDGIIKEADFGLSYQYLSEDFRRTDINNGPENKHTTWQDDTWGLNLRLVSDSPIGELTYGFDYYYDRVTSNRFDNSDVQGSVADDAKYHQLGIFIQDKIALNNDLDLIGGLRYSWVRMNANKVGTTPTPSEFDNDWEAFTSSLHLVYRLDEDTSSYIGVSQGFRAPNLSDSTRLDEFASSGTETPTDDLDPEYYTTYEAGLTVNKEKYNAGISLFYTQIKDMIVRLDDAKSNVDGHLYGAELYGEYWLTKQWAIFGNVSWVETYIRSYSDLDPAEPKRTDQMSKVPPLNGLAGVRWKPNDKFYAEVYAEMANDQDDLSQRDREDDQRIPPGGTPGFVTYNMRFGYQVTENLGLGLKLENLSDERYRIHGSGQNAAGRSALLTLHYSF